MVKKETKNKVKKGAASTPENDHVDRLEQELKDLIEVNENRSGAYSKIMKSIQKGRKNPNTL